jgi:hypothetical protein
MADEGGQGGDRISAQEFAADAVYRVATCQEGPAPAYHAPVRVCITLVSLIGAHRPAPPRELPKNTAPAGLCAAMRGRA